MTVHNSIAFTQLSSIDRYQGTKACLSVEHRGQYRFCSSQPRSLLILVVGLLTALPVRVDAATFHGLGFDILPKSVSADGSVVVGEAFDEIGSFAIRWTSGIGVTTLWEDGWASDMSADASVVVGEGWDEIGSFAVGWTSGSEATLLWEDGWASGVSADGSMVVGEGWDEIGSFAVGWTSGSGATLLWEDGWASGVSADGSMVVGEGWDEIGSFAVGWTSGSGATALWVDGWASAVSADGAVVVGEGWDEIGNFAVRWTSDSGATLLWEDGWANGVSSDGSVVVGGRWDGFDDHAVLWTSTSGATDLRALLIDEYDLSAELTGWTLEEATAVSADGTTIVGEGINPSGGFEAWRVVLPGAIPGFPGDFDNDGIVDGHDLLAWQRNPGLGELADWEAGFGEGAAQVAQVPEPTTTLLLLVGMASLLMHRGICAS